MYRMWETDWKLQPPQPVEYCPAQNAGLFLALERLASENPGVAMTCAALLKSEAQRDHVLRCAYQAAVRDVDAIRRHQGELLNRPWLGAAPFPDTVNLAFALGGGELSAQILEAAARRNPSMALLDGKRYKDLPLGQRLLAVAALAAPAEAVALASSPSLSGLYLRDFLKNHPSLKLRILSELAERGDVELPARQRAAAFVYRMASGEMDVERAIALARAPERYFRELVSVRLKARGEEAVMLDQTLEREAQMTVRSWRDASTRKLPSMVARDLYLMLAYGYTEASDDAYLEWFDSRLASALRRRLGAIVDETQGLRFRAFLADACERGRGPQVLRLADGRDRELLAWAFRGVDAEADPLAAALQSAAILEAMPAGPWRQTAARQIEAEYQRSRHPLYGLLAARAGAPSGSRFGRYFGAPQALDVAALFRDRGICAQLHLFYDDEDGVASFASFRAQYRGDAAWRWEDFGSWVRASAQRAGRRIDIYANVPFDPWKERDRTPNVSQTALAQILAERKIRPAVLVHRGHSYHLERTLRRLDPETRLVFLGSCNGTAQVSAVFAVAREAQIIATRKVGTTTVNDPLLKALNRVLLSGSDFLRWDSFWRQQEAALGGNEHFRGYVPPHRNPAAILMRAWEAFIAAGEQ